MLGTGSGSFDPDTLVILETAFDVRLHDRVLGELIPATMWRELS